MSRGTRATVEPGIYQDAYGYEVAACVNRHRRSARFPPGTPLREMRSWRKHAEVELDRLPPATVRGTLGRDAERYYLLIGHLVSWRERRSEIRAWVARYGERRRAKIHREDVLETRGVWLAEGTAPKTVNHRVAALRHLYVTLDGPENPTPCDHIKPLPVPHPIPQPVSVEMIGAVYQRLLDQERTGKLRSAKTRARFMVIASTGVRPSELRRAVAEDVDLERRIWYTRDGKGGRRPGGLYLIDDMLAAWRTFVAADAWGYFRTGSFDRVLRSCGWPANVRPYALRRSVGIALSEHGVDLADVGAFLGHLDLDTTRQHYVPILGSRMQTTAEQLAGRFRWEPAGYRGTALTYGTTTPAEESAG